MIITHYQYKAESMLNSKAFEEGALYFIEDTGNMYFDPVGGGGTRIRVASTVNFLNTENDRINLLAPIPGQIYFVIESSINYIYYNDIWYSCGVGKSYIDSIQRKNVSIESAAIGQVAVVADIDENNNPTKWEAKDLPQIPESLPNPNILTFTGAANASYDGSSPVSIAIPFGVLSETARNLLITILRNAVYVNNQSGNITALAAALEVAEIPDSGESGTDTPSIVNLFDKNTMVVEGAFINTGGNVSAQTNTAYAKIPIEPGKTYSVSRKTLTWANGGAGLLALYDDNGNKFDTVCINHANFNEDGYSVPVINGSVSGSNGFAITHDTTGNGWTFTAPEGASYLYCTVLFGGNESRDSMMVEEGDTCHDYVEFIGSSPATKIYTITNNLTNVTTNSSIESMEENGAYSAILIANDGYIIDSVVITMNGLDISSTAYNNGTINISAVTGNIIITATAIETSTEEGGDNDSPEVIAVNLFDKNTMVTSGAFISNTNTISSSANAAYATIPLEGGKTYALQRKNLDFRNYTSGNILWLNSDMEIVDSVGYTYSGFNNDGFAILTGSSIGSSTSNGIATVNPDTTGNGITFTTTEEIAYIRLTVKLSTDSTDTLMIEEGDTCHDYVEFVSNSDDEVSTTVINLFDKDTMAVEGYFINTGGTIATQTNTAYATIPLEGGKSYAMQRKELSWGNGAAGNITILNESQEVIYKFVVMSNTQTDDGYMIAGTTNSSPTGLTLQADASGKGVTFNTTEDCAYLRLTLRFTGGDSRDTFMIEEGTVCHDYVAYA